MNNQSLPLKWSLPVKRFFILINVTANKYFGVWSFETNDLLKVSLYRDMQETVQRSEGCDQCIYQVYDSHEQCDNKSEDENCKRSEIPRHCGLRSESHLPAVRRKELSVECETAAEQSMVDSLCLLRQVIRLPEEHTQHQEWFSL